MTDGFPADDDSASVMFVLCVAEFPAAVTATVYVADGVEEDVLIVSADVLPDVTEVGENDTVEPGGPFDAESVIGCGEPLVVVVAT